MVIDTGLKVLAAASALMTITLGQGDRLRTFMLVFALKILNNYLVAFTLIWYSDRYCFQFLSATSGPITMTLGSRSQTSNF